MTFEDRHWFNIAQDRVQSLTSSLYLDALDKGIAKEQARFLLPMSSKTKIYMTGNIRSWIHYLELRTGIETQKEHRDIARQVKEIFKEELPIISGALEW
jgi:thymidylate synthase (FAD)